MMYPVMTIQIPQSRWVDLDGPVHHVGWDGPSGRTFVLVHGLGGSTLSWYAVGPLLATYGRVLALDLVGFGRTPREGRRSRVSDQRRLVSRFITAVAGDEPVVLAGNSMGGAIAMLEAAIEPDHVEGVILSNSVFPWVWGAYPAPVVMAGFGLYQLPRIGEWLSRQRLRGISPARAVRAGLSVIAADATSIDRDLVEAHVEQLMRQRDDVDAGAAFLEAARSLMALGRRPRTAKWILDRVRQPVLVIHGRRDRLVPYRFAERAVSGRVGWDLVTLRDVGHIPQMEAPERWIAAIERWLPRLAEPSSPASERRDAATG
jgi:pimeloyl-ACP methyl ester carboxylesterase